MNHPFVDGNKRVAVAVMITFLAINGYAISKDAMTLYGFIIESLEVGVFSYDRLAVWLRENTKKIEEA